METLLLGDSNELIKKNHIDMINKIYYNMLKMCKQIIYNNEQIQSQCFDLFEREWMVYNKLPKKYLDNITKDPYLLLAINLTDEIKSIDT